MEKSSKYTGVQCFEFRESRYFKSEAKVILKINFDTNEFYENLETIFKDWIWVGDTLAFANIDEKIEWVLKEVAGFVFDWIYEYNIATFTFSDCLTDYVAARLNETWWLVSVEEDDGKEEHPIHVLNYDCDYGVKKKIEMYEIHKTNP